jgi:selenocysteine-specific elongation factor
MTLAGTFVVGTAGHIDHGKSTLVKALTSIDPDRLEEEKRRGMTIDLGFAYLDLASGRRVAIVDVPGHQRFLKNMLAGVHGMDAVLFVVAADEGPMPQTREHLAIVDLLGIEHGVVVITKADVVEPAWLEVVHEETAGLMRGSSLRQAPIIEVSSTTGKGLDALRATLDAELATAIPRPDQGRPRLPVDRSFPIAGFGTVVTGTLVGGSLHPGMELMVWPAGTRARIRGLQQHNKETEIALPGTRTAVNLSGIEHAQVRRGDVLAPAKSLYTSRRLDARLTVLREARAPLHHRQRVLLYHGTAEYPVELTLLDSDELRPGEHGPVQLFAATPVVALDGDRFILRVASPAETVAGGVLLDVAARRHRRHDRALLESLARRESAGLPAIATLELAKHVGGLTTGQLAARLGVSADRLEPILASEQQPGGVHRAGQSWFADSTWQPLVARMTATLADYHRAQPLRAGMPREELRSRTGLQSEVFAGVVTQLLRSATLADRGGELSLPGHQPGLSPQEDASVRGFLGELELQPFNPPPLGDLMRRHQVSPRLLQYLIAQRRVVRLNDDTVFSRSAYDDAVRRIRTHLSDHRTLTVAAARDVLGSSRRYVLPLLEWLDSQKITRRVGDDRILRD